jgi:hypothetical protein
MNTRFGTRVFAIWMTMWSSGEVTVEFVRKHADRQMENVPWSNSESSRHTYKKPTNSSLKRLNSLARRKIVDQSYEYFSRWQFQLGYTRTIKR